MKKYGYVNIKMGTYNSFRYSNGNVYPVTGLPHGMASFTIQNDDSKGGWFYDPLSKSFEGIRLAHQPSPWMEDYGRLVFYGQRGEKTFEFNKSWGSYDNKNVVLEPTYMEGKVYRDSYMFKLVPTHSGGIIQFEFSAETGNHINIVGKDKTVFEYDENEGYLKGYTTSVVQPVPCGEMREYFVVKTNRPFRIETEANAGRIAFEGSNIELRLSISFISYEQALWNLEKEIGEKDIEEVKKEGESIWENSLSKIKIEDEDEDKLKTFYSCLYRVFLWPRQLHEIDRNGKIVHFNLTSGEITGGYMYSDNGFWDTYRTLYPLYSLIDTDLYAKIIEGYYNYYLDSGWLPKWLSPHNFGFMPGNLIEATFADAIVKDIVNKEFSEKLLSAMIYNAENHSPNYSVLNAGGRKGSDLYRKYGYIPFDSEIPESVNETLDSCYGDYCIAQAAKKLGHSEIAEVYYRYAKNYVNLFDTDSGFMRGKDSNGEFRKEPFESRAWGGDYTEGSAWQSSFAVYHDIEGLNCLYNGKLMEKIDECINGDSSFEVGAVGCEIHEMSEMICVDAGQCAISNQPSFHIPFIYSELGNVQKTAYAVEKLAKSFRADIEGYPGDEDNGSMAAWYVFASMGFYPMCPSRPDFTMSVPLFENISITLANGKKLKINRAKCLKNDDHNKISYSKIMQGGDLFDLLYK